MKRGETKGDKLKKTKGKGGAKSEIGNDITQRGVHTVGRGRTQHHEESSP